MVPSSSEELVPSNDTVLYTGVAVKLADGRMLAKFVVRPLAR